MSPSVELQKLIFDRLVADPGVHAVVGDRIYENPPEGATFPYVSFGPSDVIEDDAECITGRVETIQIDCWARQDAQISPVKALSDAVKSALHLFAGDMTTHALVEMRVVAMRAFMDPDGLTAHGVVTVEAMVEEA
jgi:hypothetical protein